MASRRQEDDDGDDEEVRHCLRRQLRKTKMCMHFQKGKCQFDDKCSFAHDEKEIQHAPDLCKTRLCKVFMEKGTRGCNRRDCTFAHGEEELKSTDLFYKTTKCTWWEKDQCRAGDSCRFAHGDEDLRKTEPPSKGSEGHPDDCAGPCADFTSRRGCADDAECEKCHLCSMESLPKLKRRRRDSSEDRQGVWRGSKRRRGDREGDRPWEDNVNQGPPPGSQAYEAWRHSVVPHAAHPAPAPAPGYGRFQILDLAPAPSYGYPPPGYPPPAYGYSPAPAPGYGAYPPAHPPPSFLAHPSVYGSHHGYGYPPPGPAHHAPPTHALPPTSHWTPPPHGAYGGAGPPTPY